MRRDADASKGIKQCKKTWRYKDPDRTGAYGCHTFACRLEIGHDGPHIDHFGIWDEEVVEASAPAQREGK